MTLASYDDGVDGYLAGSMRQPCLPLLTQLTQQVAAPSRVLEIGSGPGFDAAYLRANGYQVQPTDASDGFLAHLRAAGWRPVRYHVDHDDPPDGAWDAVYANAVLHHLQRDRLPAAIARLGKTLRPGAVLVASVKTGRDDGWSLAKLDAPRWFTYWSAADLRRVVDQAGWEVAALAERSGTRADWIDVVARNKAIHRD